MLAAVGLVAISFDQRALAYEGLETPPSATGKVKFRIVGYLPEYRAADIDPDVGRYLTDLIYFAARPDAGGELKLTKSAADHLPRLKRIKAKYDTALSLCVGGWNRSEGFAKLAASDTARRRFAVALVAFCTEHQFAGVDIDWEHPASESEQSDYAALLTTIKQAFSPHHLELTIAVAGWQSLAAESIQAVDRVHLMAYDASGRHSTYEFAESDISRLLKAGVPADKICLGVPFYGKGIQDRSRVLTFAEIFRKHKLANDVDAIDGVFFNGAATIGRKTRLAISQNLAGVMIWEIGQDAPGDDSLLKVIRQTVDESHRAK